MPSFVFEECLPSWAICLRVCLPHRGLASALSPRSTQILVASERGAICKWCSIMLCPCKCNSVSIIWTVMKGKETNAVASVSFLCAHCKVLKSTVPTGASGSTRTAIKSKTKCSSLAFPFRHLHWEHLHPLAYLQKTDSKCIHNAASSLRQAVSRAVETSYALLM